MPTSLLFYYSNFSVRIREIKKEIVFFVLKDDFQILYSWFLA
ncbi:hypothetical protein NT03LS_2632 [Listeria seeligeri FSL N1-067]|uniref:Uncharacterized protein n=1 Tax=Listeria seeligeri FSL N1-067 TaxID=702453 RepID=E3ZSZ2_LISSE|nr:hypothetical protein NT03LS_2632 [Listeria seeligeri FSL N1-067]